MAGELRIPAGVVATIIGLWIGVLTLCLGGEIVLQPILPSGFMLERWACLLLAGGLSGLCLWRRRWMRAAVLSFVFLAVGIGLGLVAQIADVRLPAGWGIPLWAAVSVGIVILSGRWRDRRLVWMPLFLGGMAGYLRVELLMLFLATAPAATVIGIGMGLMLLIGVTGEGEVALIRAVNRWSIGGLVLVLLWGSEVVQPMSVGVIIMVGFLSVLALWAMRHGRVWVLHLAIGMTVGRLVPVLGRALAVGPGAGMALMVVGTIGIIGAVWRLRAISQRADTP